MFDFPTNDPTYISIGVPQFGYRGDVRYLGVLGEGPLPLEPLTALAAHPAYGSSGEILEGRRGSGFETNDGFRTRKNLSTTPPFMPAIA